MINYITKAATARILNIKAKDVAEIRVVKGKVLARYKINRGNCCTFISFKTYQQDFYSFRINAHLTESYEVLNMADVNDLDSIRAFVKFESSHDTHLVEIYQTDYTCSCTDFQNQKQYGLPFPGKKVCRHLLPVAKHFGFNSFSELIKNNKSFAKAA
ncbi:hypothetical protein NIES2100_05240 [Calothrix sp. NIES-2100]|uniref:hypothetical protein n=1 Tax=Calothrix sp. NIES-2100 TaxID=1954172 RepID=UPI000B61514B|nr:hypothetical protein NIES2100_05240 [Calothrix sp. NIES-2100]